MSAPKKPPPLPAHWCGKCPARWSAATFCHCRACHRTFTGITTFEAHRSGPDTRRECSVDRLLEVKPGVWGTKEQE